MTARQPGEGRQGAKVRPETGRCGDKTAQTTAAFLAFPTVPGKGLSLGLLPRTAGRLSWREVIAFVQSSLATSSAGISESHVKRMAEQLSVRDPGKCGTVTQKTEPQQSIAHCRISAKLGDGVPVT
jgi:hypothetical protein